MGQGLSSILSMTCSQESGVHNFSACAPTTVGREMRHRGPFLCGAAKTISQLDKETHTKAQPPEKSHAFSQVSDTRRRRDMLPTDMLPDA